MEENIEKTTISTSKTICQNCEWMRETVDKAVEMTAIIAVTSILVVAITLAIMMWVSFMN